MRLLNEIAMIRAGVPFRGKVKTVLEGGYLLVQIKDVDKAREVTTEGLPRVEALEAREHHILRRGDVLMVARGTRNHAAVFCGEGENAIAGSQIFVLRARSAILPDYLAWYLNQPDAQRHIRERISGSFVPFIPRDALDTLTIHVPPLEKQKLIAEISKLAMEEQRILEAIKDKRRQLLNGMLGKMIVPKTVLL
jgi:hypothetical protein